MAQGTYQTTTTTQESIAASYERTWENRRKGGRSVSDGTAESYYGLPAIHKPHWKWEIYLYFFLGGIAGGSYVIATVARLFGGAEGRAIARVGHYLSLATLIPCPILLTMDLKRPERFYHMLRVLKLSSPMSVGTWGLVVFSAFSVLSALAQAGRDGLMGRGRLAGILLALPSRLLSLLGAGPAFFVGGYTGVLLAVTAVPLWARNHLLMGPLFATSALSNAAAAITLVLSLARGTSPQALKRLERLDSMTLLAELCLMLVFKQRLGPTIGRPLAEGRLAALHTYGVLGLGVLTPLLLQSRSVVFGAQPSRPLVGLASLLVLAGGLLLRYVILMAGKESADDPGATFEAARGEE